MWWNRELRKLPTLYFLIFFIVFTQIFAYQRYFQDKDTFLLFKQDTAYLSFYWNFNHADQRIYLHKKDNADSITKNLETWAEAVDETYLYVRNEMRRRYYQNASLSLREYPTVNDLHILIDLANLYGTDYELNKLLMPEAVLGKDKWEALRKHYTAIGTPETIRDLLLPPYEHHLENAAPKLKREASGYHFFISKILEDSSVLLASWPSLQYYNISPPLFLHQFFGNRSLLLFFFLFCSMLLATRISEDRSLGTIRLLATMPQGRLRYFLSSYGTAFLLAITALFAALAPTLLIGLFQFGFHSFDYPHRFMLQSYRSLSPLPIMQGTLKETTMGNFTRGREQIMDISSLEEMFSSIESWKFLLIVFGFLILFISLLLLINFILSSFTKNQGLSLGLSLIPIIILAMSLYDNEFCATTFPYNPFAAIDIATTAPGYQKFTSLSGLIALLIWNLIAFLIALWRIQKRDLD